MHSKGLKGTCNAKSEGAVADPQHMLEARNGATTWAGSHQACSDTHLGSETSQHSSCS